MQEEIDIQVYEIDARKCPFNTWLKRLSRQVRAKLRIYINRMRQGNYSACKSLGNGLWEIRVHTGPGYRVYFGKEKDRVVILLCGGDKGSQKQDIARAKKYWMDYKNSGKGGRSYGAD